ncbi:hypothetical protein BOX15_Mlig028716g2, partial [Macrostomum lignano]
LEGKAMPLSCRYYERKFPELEEVVMVNVRSIQEMGAYVHLLEYNNIEGMILLSELSRRRIRSINKLIRVGRNEVVLVIRVDKNKGYIDLSKRRVSQEEVEKCEEKFAKAKAVNQILKRVGEKLGYEKDEQLEELYNKTAWHFDRKYNRPGASFETFKHSVTNPEVLNECEIDDQVKEVLLENIRRRLMPQSVRIRSDIEVSCFTYEGIDAVKAALKAGLKHATEEFPLHINLIAPPEYVVTTSTLDRQEGLVKMRAALDDVKANIEGRGGVFSIKREPWVISDTEEAELKQKLEDLELANKEVSGDEDSDGDEDDDEEGGGDDGDENGDGAD